MHSLTNNFTTLVDSFLVDELIVFSDFLLTLSLSVTDTLPAAQDSLKHEVVTNVTCDDSNGAAKGIVGRESLGYTIEIQYFHTDEFVVVVKFDRKFISSYGDRGRQLVTEFVLVVPRFGDG